MDGIFILLFTIISFALWLPAVWCADHVSKGKPKRRKIIIGILLVACFFLWVEGAGKHGNKIYNSGYEAGYQDGYEEGHIE